MKIELDLEKLRLDMRMRQEMQANHGGVTLTVRQWGESLEFFASLPEEIAIEQMQRTIENRIQAFMQYAPDVSDIKPSEIRVQSGSNGRKQAIGSFFYCSQIVDYWEKQKSDAVAYARRNEHYNTLFHLKESYDEVSEVTEGECWQKEAAADLARRLEALL